MSQSRCALIYSFPTNLLIHRAKTEGHAPSLQLLAELFVRRFAEEISDQKPDLLIPVPLHPQRQRERGYNQSLELAQRLGALLGIPVSTTLCWRRLPTPHQQGLSALERRQNLRGAFQAHPTSANHLAIIDDVITTGSTVEAVARALLSSVAWPNALQIEAWSIARTPPKS